MTPSDHTIIRFGAVGEQSFARDCTPGDWKSWQVQFPERFARPPTVIVSPTSSSFVNTWPAPVGIAQNVTRSGFTLAARNAHSRPGRAGFVWMAVLEAPDGSAVQPPDLRMGVTQPSAVSALSTDHLAFRPGFRPQFQSVPVALV